MRRIALAALLLVTVSSCADRERINCPRQKNKAPRASVADATTTTTAAPTGRCL
jgi:hypothetical protein